MLQTQAPLIRREELAGERLWLGFHAPELATRLRPGHLLAFRPSATSFDPLVRVPVAVSGADATTGVIQMLFANSDAPSALVGQVFDLLGPIGRGWQITPDSRNLLLLGTEAELGALLFLATDAIKRSINVALFIGAAMDRPALPGMLVPATLEYQLARGDVPEDAALELLDRQTLSWADALVTTLPRTAYPALADRIRAGRMQWTPGFAQGLILAPMACFVGICDTCLVAEARRPWRACVDGPQCDVRDFVR